jgi:hypothetical protein
LEARVSARALYDDLWVVGGRAVSNGGRDVALWLTPWRPPVLAEMKETKASSSTSCLSEGVLGWVGSGGLGLWWLLHGLLLGLVDVQVSQVSPFSLPFFYSFTVLYFLFFYSVFNLNFHSFLF